MITLATLLLAVAGPAGCSDDGSGPGAQELLGLWGAVEYEYTADADATVTEDLVDDLAATYSIELIAGGRYSERLATLQSTVISTGTFDVGEHRLTLHADDGGTTVYRLTFNEVFLTLHDDEVLYDFGGDGTEEPADLRILLDRF